MMETAEPRDEFNERTGRKAYWEAKGGELERYIMRSTGVVDPKFTDNRHCPLCGAENEDSDCIWIKEGLFYVKCKKCNMVYIASPLKQHILEKAYESSEAMTRWLDVLQSQEDLDLSKFTYMMTKLDQYVAPGELDPHPTILDVGASYGLFCHTAKQQWGYVPTGLELSEEAYEIYIKRYYKEFDMFKVKLEDHVFGMRYDVVTMWEVLEHIPDPHALLQQAHKALNNNGILGILVPNLNSKTNMILHEKSKAFGANHLNYWNIDTLTVQLERAGFEVLHWETLIGDVNTWYNHLSYEEPYTGNLVHPDHEEATSNTLGQGEGYKLFVVARKSEGTSP